MTKRDTQRRKVLELSRDGNLSLAAISKRTGIPKTTCARWIRRYGQESDTPASQGYDRSAAIQLAMINKDLRELRTCENHYEEEDLRRLCTSLNAAWLRHLEIASRDMAQVGHTDAIRILDKAIEKVRVEAESLT